MKLKELFWQLVYTPPSKTYCYEIISSELPDYGSVKIAKWLHPKTYRIIPSIEEINELKKFLNPGDICIDIGAHAGDSTIPIALAVGKEGRVFALEPNKYVYPTLLKNSQLNEEKYTIIPLNFAAAPKDEEMEFEYSDPGFGNGGNHENISKWKHGHAFKLKVQGRNLVRFIKNEYPQYLSCIKYIKVDAEGFDLSILNSLEEIIRLSRPFLRAEIMKGTSSKYKEEMLTFFKNHNYDPYIYKAENLFNGDKVQSSDLLSSTFDIFAIPNKGG